MPNDLDIFALWVRDQVKADIDIASPYDDQDDHGVNEIAIVNFTFNPGANPVAEAFAAFIFENDQAGRLARGGAITQIIGPDTSAPGGTNANLGIDAISTPPTGHVNSLFGERVFSPATPSGTPGDQAGQFSMRTPTITDDTQYIGLIAILQGPFA